MANNVFISMAQIARFSKLIAGQLAPVYKDEKFFGNALVPKELDVFISDPMFGDTLLWWVTNMGSVPYQEHGGEKYQFTLVSDYGIALECRYDQNLKQFVKLHAKYDFFDFDLSGRKSTIEDVVSFLNMSLLDFLKFVKDNLKLNKALLENVNAYIERIESY